MHSDTLNKYGLFGAIIKRKLITTDKSLYDHKKKILKIFYEHFLTNL